MLPTHSYTKAIGPVWQMEPAARILSGTKYNGLEHIVQKTKLRTKEKQTGVSTAFIQAFARMRKHQSMLSKGIGSIQ